MQRGFSLIELLTVIALIGITAGLALPSYRSTVINNRLASAANDLVGAINVARSEAIRSRTTIIVKAATGGWDSGWTVTDAAGTRIIQSYQADGDLDIEPDSPETVLGFTARGIRTETGQRLFTIKQGAGEHWRCVVLNAAGAPKVWSEKDLATSEAIPEGCKQ